jgi:glycosyltransferase involved in cell wall biosynthesis
MRAATERLVESEHYHLALLSGKQTFPAIEGLHNLPLVVDMCDATSIQIQGHMRHARLTRSMILRWDYFHVRRIEKHLIRRAAHVLFASQRDLEALDMETSPCASVIPNGINLEYWHRSASHRGQKTVVFTGGMHYPPNTDAALYLIDEIFPIVQHELADTQLFIVGRDPTPRLISAGQRPGVTVTGFVEDVRPYLDRATVFAAPLRFGAGIQNKVLEAMAMEVPVVASPVAAGGLRTEAGQLPPLQVASDRSSFAGAILTALRQGEKDASPDSEGRRFVSTHFEWGSSGKKLSRVIEQIATGEKEREICSVLP